MSGNRARREGDEKERGQTIVEFALVISFLFLIIFGLVEFSRLFFSYATMSHGTREAARWGIVQGQKSFAIDDPNELRTRVEDRAEERMFLIGNSVDVTATTPDSDTSGYEFCPHECRLVVRATSDYNPWFPFVPTFEMVAQTTMHFE
jgi:Flp pilus assembly protein TadG